MERPGVPDPARRARRRPGDLHRSELRGNARVGAYGAHVPGPLHVPLAMDPGSARGGPHLRRAGRRTEPQITSKNALIPRLSPINPRCNANFVKKARGAIWLS